MRDWERAGHCYILTLLTCTFWSSCCRSTMEQEQDELQARPQAAALVTPAVP